MASRIGPFVATGVLTGRDPRTREMPETLAEQCANLFTLVREVVANAGGSIGDILRMTFWVADYRDRAALNEEWVKMFPQPEHRPARQTIAAQLDGGCRIQCDFLAVIDG
ncbi:RidA family protein [Microbacterium sp. NPDC058062]|uniref:RidA family protein n=1 Tax=Microbacterium sp. NPDC058062 TaxID=3346320 RepID=UPI0036DABB07